MVDNVQDIELGTLTASGWDTSSAPTASQPNVYQAVTDPTVNSDTSIGVRIGDVWINTVSGIEFRNISNADGASIWRPMPRNWQSGVAVSHTGNTDETALATIALAAGAIGIGGVLQVYSRWTVTNSGNNKSCFTRFGASGAGVGGTLLDGAVVTTVLNLGRYVEVMNRATAALQIGSANGGTGGWATQTTAWQTATINTAAASELVFTADLANSGETITLESYRVTLTRPDIGP